MSLRKPETRAAYKVALSEGKMFNFTRATYLEEWTHWGLVVNEFPYDLIAKTHHLLIPNRPVRGRDELLYVEEVELRNILREISPNYDAYLENFPRHQSVKNHFHVHLLEYEDG
jgi:hypothetical protein